MPGLLRKLRLVAEALHEAGDVDDGSSVRALANQASIVATGHSEQQGLAVDFDELDLSA